MSLYIDLKNGDVSFFEVTPESRYLAGLYGGVPILRGETKHRANWHRIAAKITDREVLVRRIRKVARMIELEEEEEVSDEKD